MAIKTRAAVELERVIGVRRETRLQAAENLRIARSTLDCFLSGHRRPGRSNAALVHDKYGVPASWWDQPAPAAEPAEERQAEAVAS